MQSEKNPWYIETAELAEMLFPEAGEIWLASRTPYISPKTFHEYELNLRTLGKTFAETKLREITADQIRAYQAMRTSQKCGPSAVNHECSVLQQMLKRIAKWHEIEPQYQAMRPLDRGPGRVLSSEERTRLFHVSARKENWEGAFLFAVLSINTSAGPKEILTLRLQDVDIEDKKEPVINIQPAGAKNTGRIRSIPLNEEGFKAAQLAVERAKKLGSTAPDHFLFPFRIHRSHFDPTRHQTTFKTAWLKMVAAADLPGFRMYDLRHHCITELLEDPRNSEETVQAIAGHVSRRMMQRYSHIRSAAKRSAVCGLYSSSGEVFRGTDPRVLLPDNTLTNEVVLDMFRCELPVEIIAAKIRNAAAYCFDVSVGTIKQLRSSGLPDQIILAMVRRGEKGGI
jgi:integrase